MVSHRLVAAALIAATCYILYAVWLGLTHAHALSRPETPHAARLTLLASGLSLAACAAALVAGLRALRGASMGLWGWLSFGLALVVILGAVWALRHPLFAASALRAAGTAMVPALGLLLLWPLVGLLSVFATRIWGRPLAMLLIAANLFQASPLPAQGGIECPDGCTSVLVSSTTVEECWLFIFCDSYTLNSFDCRDAADTTQICEADIPPEPEPEPEPEPDRDTVLFACFADVTAYEIYGWLCYLVAYIVFELILDV